MPPDIMAGIYVLGIVWLFRLARDQSARTSMALWVPVIWVLLGSSRMVSQWLNVTVVTQSSDQYLEGSPLDRMIISLLLGIGLVILWVRTRRSMALIRANWPLVLFMVYCFVSIFWSDYSEVAFKRWLKFIGNFVMVLVVLTESDPAVAMRQFLVRTGFILIPMSVLLIKYYPDFGRGYSPWTYTTYYTGVSDTKNGLGVICLLSGLGFVWCCLNEWFGSSGSRRQRSLIAYGVGLVMTLWLFWKVDSATSFFCFSLMAMSLVLLSTVRVGVIKSRYIHFSIAGVILFVLVTLIALDTGESLTGLMGRDMTLTGRTELWGQLYQMHTTPWFGTGFESFFLGDRLKELWAKYWWKPNQAHNGYFEIFLNLGWVGIVLFGYVLINGYKNVVNSLQTNPRLGRIKFAYLASALIYNITEAGVKVMHPAWIAFLLAATAIPDSTKTRDHTRINH